MPGEPPSGNADLPASWSAQEPPVYDLCLYVSGTTPLSARAIVNIRRLCDTHLPGRYTLEIVDLSRNAHRAALDQVVGTPTLLRRSPLPLRRFIGDLTETRRLLERLDIPVDPA